MALTGICSSYVGVFARLSIQGGHNSLYDWQPARSVMHCLENRKLWRTTAASQILGYDIDVVRKVFVLR